MAKLSLTRFLYSENTCINNLIAMNTMQPSKLMYLFFIYYNFIILTRSLVL